MTMAMGIEVSAMALNTCAAHAAIDRGITIATYTNSTKTISWVMARGTGCMDSRNPVTTVAGHTKCCRYYCYSMIVAMAVKVGRMTIGTGATANNRCNLRPVYRVFNSRRRSVTM